MILDSSLSNDIPQTDADQFFEESLSGFLIVDDKNKIIRCNKRIAAWLERSSEEILNKKFSDLLSIGSKIYYETHLAPLLKMQGFFDEILVELSNTSGKKLKIFVNAKESSPNENGLRNIYYTLVEASDRVMYEQNLQFAKKVAEKQLVAERENVLLREQLIAVLGHDLRNPLGAVSMTVGYLERSMTGDKQKNLLGILKRSCYRMNELIGHVMDFARTRMGEGIVLTPGEVELEPVLQHVVDELKYLFPDRQINTVFSFPEPVYCDPDRISQLASNLLANAFTHGNPESPVWFSAGNQNDEMTLSVANDGEPIPESLQNILFTPFKRESDRPSKNGLGLGLYIANQIALAHGGTLAFTSDEKQTRFTFSMTAKK
ncbi:MAG: PAS domain-containing sensor histidine kinase [Weeksellaceae bacterium]|nr:PAS domain-containing sensor histidine kinase [Weeksellaceae bacterium]